MSHKSAVKAIFGTGSLGAKKPAAEGGGGIDDPQLVQTIMDEFKKHNQLEIDTARIYGSEIFLGQLKYAEQGFKLSTKIPGLVPGSQSKENVAIAVNASFADLKTDKVHILYLHAPDPTTPIAETLAAVHEEYKKGRFERFGVSNFTAKGIEQIVNICDANGYLRPSAYQGMYNLVVRRNEQELFPVLRKYNISFYAYSPLAGSFLVDTEDENTRRRFDPSSWVGKFYVDTFHTEASFKARDKFREIATKEGVDLVELSQRWLANHSHLKKENGDAVIIGGKTLSKIQQALDNLDKGPLSAAAVNAIEAVWNDFKDSSPNWIDTK